jgi:general secretion pathway protein D
MGLQAVISSANHSGLIQALGTDSKVKVLATPSVFTANNQPAIVDIATQVPYISGQALSTVTTGSSAVVNNTVDFASIGFTLYVTPRITRDGLVTVDCVADASDLVANLVLGSGSNAVTAPEFDDRYTDTTVTVKDGDTAVIGGLIQDRQTLTINKVPVLSDIPVLGQFFRSREKQRTRVELMVFLTPHVVATSEQATQLAKRIGGRVIVQEPDLQREQPNLRLTPEELKQLMESMSDSVKTNKSPTPAPGTTGPAKSAPTGLDPSGKPILNPFNNPPSGTPPAGTPPAGTPPTGTPPTTNPPSNP